MKAIDYGAELDPQIGIAPQSFSGTTEVDGAAVDATKYGGGVVTCVTGAATGTPTTQQITFTVEQSDDGSTNWTTLQDADGNNLTVVVDAANTAKQLRLDLGRSKQYIRVKGVPAFTGGTSPTLMGSAALSLGDKKYVG